jgi:hypothetical protein
VAKYFDLQYESLSKMRRYALSVLFAIGTIVRGAAMAQFTTEINVPPDTVPESVGSNTQVNIFNGAMLAGGFNAGAPDNTSTNIEVNISGGSVGDSLRSYKGSTVNVNGGRVGFNLFVSGGRANISNGTVLGLQALNGGSVYISGGVVGSASMAREGSIFEISGGRLGSRFQALSESRVNMRGGSIDSNFQALTGSAVRIFGGNFRLDGSPVSGLDVIGNALPFDFMGNFSLLSGTFADGTPFAFGPRTFDEVHDSFATGSLTLERAVLPPIGAPVIMAATDPVPNGIREGQRLMVGPGSTVTIALKAGWGSTIEVNTGGRIDNVVEAVGATIDVLGGSVNQINAMVETTINLKGGSVREIHALKDSSVNIFGKQFTLNGLPISGLIPGQPLTITTRFGLLEGTLSDGSAIQISLGSRDPPYKIAANANLRLVLVPEPTDPLICLISLALLRAATRSRLPVHRT